MKVVVLAGGLSDERNVSLSSGAQVRKALEENGHKAFLLDVYTGLPGTITTFEEAYDRGQESSFSKSISKDAPDLNKIKEEHNHQAELVGPNVLAVCKTADVVFLALHGAIGESGKIQALFDLYDISYTGSGYQGSMLAMDKILAKQIMVSHHIPTPQWIEWDDTQTFSLPCVVKPNANGSSIGVSICETQSEFELAIKNASAYHDKILIEEKICGREFSLGILLGRPLPIIEIIPPEDSFYDYQNKFQTDGAKEECPANLTPTLVSTMQQLALQVHKVLGLGSYSRIDFLLDSQDHLYCIEANTLPGMTPFSLLPQEAAACGISFNELCETMLQNPYSSPFV